MFDLVGRDSSISMLEVAIGCLNCVLEKRIVATAAANIYI